MFHLDSQIVFELFLVGVSLRFKHRGLRHSLWFALSTVSANQSEALNEAWTSLMRPVNDSRKMATVEPVSE